IAMTTMIERLRRWFEYEKDSHALVLAALEEIPEEKRGTPEYAKASGLLAHVALARWLWLVRLGEAPADHAPQREEDFFPGAVAPDELRRRVVAMQAAWSAYLAKLDDAALARAVTYQSMDSGRYENTVEEVLTQLFGH